MQKPLEIVFRSIPHSEAIEAAVQERIDKLDERHGVDALMGCVVTIDTPHRHNHKGKLYSVNIDMSVRGAELVVNRTPEAKHAHEDVYVAIRDAFDAMERQVAKFLAKQRREVKTHEGPPQGRIDRLFEVQDYGFITTPDGRHIYFHRNALVDIELEDLEIGDPVEFIEQVGDEGPQASMVRKINEFRVLEAGPAFV